MTDQPLHHIRRAALPWQQDRHMTECGKRQLDVASCIGRDDFEALKKRHGKTRTAMLVCITCMQTAQRHPTFEQSPVRAVAREVDYMRHPVRREVSAINRELRAVASLIERYPEEFRQLVEQQRWRDKEAAAYTRQQEK